MAHVFVSYNRRSAAIVGPLAGDIESLGHSVWYDRELSGGQSWWDQILATIRSSDVFVFVLDPASLNSAACKSEYGYAAAIGRPILPILVSGEVSTNLLPPALSRVQYVDYRSKDREAAFRLARAFTALPPAAPLPDPLPAPPEAPLSYLGGLTELVGRSAPLSFEEQSALVVDLKRGMRDPETADDARVLLERLRRRRDLLATSAEEIDEVLGMARPAPPPSPADPPPDRRAERPADTRRVAAAALPDEPGRNERVRAGAAGAAAGLTLGIATFAVIREDAYEFALLTALGGAIAGAICGNRRQRIGTAIVGALIAWLLAVVVIADNDAVSIGAVLGTPLGAVAGALAAVAIEKRKASL